MSSEKRCPWCKDDPQYCAYHDDEWGVPQYDSLALFEKLCLEGFQAGLSWLTVLRKREHFRVVFDNFDPEKIVLYDEAKIEALMQDKGIIRNRLKVKATVSNAQAFLDLSQKQEFSDFLWNYVDGKPIQTYVKEMSDVPTQTDISQQMSKDLKKLGFKFIGSTICYAFMQSVGMVNDHIVTCAQHEKCVDLAKNKVT